MQVAKQPESGVLTFPKVGMLAQERTLIGSHLIIAFLALMTGIFMGPFQTFRRSPWAMDVVPEVVWDVWMSIPVFQFYYQALTVHGVMNALFFTTFFIVGFSYFVTQRSLQRPLWNTNVAWGAFALMLVGLLLVLYTLLDPLKASVLYTFYPPMIADPLFYVGLVLLVVGSWLATLTVFMTYRAWTKENPGRNVPLAVYAILANYIMWDIASLGVAVEVLFMLLPASLGLITTTDPQMARALFWFFGHPLVYFWLIPAYVSWYTMLPTQAGGKLFSDPLARVAFLMIFIFSLPVGVHHLYADPGVSNVAKGIHTILTFVVAVPSFMTAFNVGAALERAGRRNGAKGPIAWLWKQKWDDPVVAAQLSGMILFIMGGFSGLIQASLTLNIALHNTSWVPGHFHMTLGGAITLTYIGIMYWMLPMVTGRALLSKKIALAQVFTWLIGMLIFGHGMGAAGIAGAPRRAEIGTSTVYSNPLAEFWLNSSAIAGGILMISAILLYINFFGTFFSKKAAEPGAPIQTVGDPTAPRILERWGLWIGVAVMLLLIAWGPVFAENLNISEGFNAPVYNPARPAPLWE